MVMFDLTFNIWNLQITHGENNGRHSNSEVFEKQAIKLFCPKISAFY